MTDHNKMPAFVKLIFISIIIATSWGSISVAQQTAEKASTAQYAVLAQK